MIGTIPKLHPSRWHILKWSCILFDTFYFLPLLSSYKTAHGHWPHVNVCRVSCGDVFNMPLVLSITSYFHYNIWGCMSSTGPFQYKWLKGFIYSSCYYHHQIGSIHLSHCYIFSVVVCLRCLLHHILLLIAYTIRENREFVFISIVEFTMSANNRILFVLKIVFVCLHITPSHYHHCANLSEDIELIKCLSYIFCRVCE